MSKTLAEVHAELDEFYEGGCVGMLLIHKAPDRRMEVWTELTIKTRELDEPTRAALETLTQRVPMLKSEVVCDKDGQPDRIKVTRRL